jgi:hypothetical protein
MEQSTSKALCGVSMSLSRFAKEAVEVGAVKKLENASKV